MLEVGLNKLDNNLFLVEKGESIANRVINNFDLQGINCLFITHSYKFSGLGPDCSTKFYTMYDEIPRLILDNIFRIKILIIAIEKDYTYVLDDVREITDLPIIFIGRNLEDFTYTKRYSNDFMYIYEMYKDANLSSRLWNTSKDNYEDYFLSTSCIKNIKSDWTSTLKNLIIEYHRNVKIELILNSNKK